MEELFAVVTDDDGTPIKKIGAEGIVRRDGRILGA
jgi:hypothetical protein